MRGRREPDPVPLNLELWELELVRRTAARIRTLERDDLESELALHLIRVKRRQRARAHLWKAYLTTALRNKAANWIRDRQRHERSVTHLDASVTNDESMARAEFLGSSEAGHDLRTAFAAVWDELSPEVRELWQILMQEDGNQVQAARRLRKHRNTVRAQIRRIRETLRRHGF
jgi:RNA polymerase sigma factor (sigma-70 family)